MDSNEVSDLAASFQRMKDGIDAIAEDMRAEGIHVGMGMPSHCVNCGKKWPCPESEPERHDAE